MGKSNSKIISTYQFPNFSVCVCRIETIGTLPGGKETLIICGILSLFRLIDRKAKLFSHTEMGSIADYSSYVHKAKVCVSDFTS